MYMVLRRESIVMEAAGPQAKLLAMAPGPWLGTQETQRTKEATILEDKPSSHLRGPRNKCLPLLLATPP